MKIAQALQSFRDFDVAQSKPTFWVFKKRATSTKSDLFTAVSVIMGKEFRAQLKDIVKHYQSSHTLVESYSLLSQPCEDGFLAEPCEKTLFPSLQKLIDQVPEECLSKSVKELNNAAGYVLRLRHNDQVIYCVKKAGTDWATRKQKGVMNIFFIDSGLELMDSPSFNVSRQFDFFVVGENALIANKLAFESLLSHRAAYEKMYAELKREPGFASAIADFAVFDSFIGKNRTHLRRMAVIKERGYYNKPDYMERLRQVNNQRGWGIIFDGQGRIVPTLDKMRVILHVLLDHRLRSELSDNQYDVPSTTTV